MHTNTGIRQPFNYSIIVSVQSTAIRSHSRFIQYATSDWTRFSFWCCRVHFFPAPFENFIYAQSSSACTKNLHVRVNKITSVLFICWHVCGVRCITYIERENLTCFSFASTFSPDCCCCCCCCLRACHSCCCCCSCSCSCYWCRWYCWRCQCYCRRYSPYSTLYA